tara:strand:+ start:147 stop:320 length:174 start_codon:yes stop_codon:yes gene_type:complete
MKIHTKTINGLEITAYNDSNAEWVVQVEGFSTYFFDKRKITMKDAMQLMADIFAREV